NVVEEVEDDPPGGLVVDRDIEVNLTRHGVILPFPCGAPRRRTTSSTIAPPSARIAPRRTPPAGEVPVLTRDPVPVGEALGVGVGAGELGDGVGTGGAASAVTVTAVGSPCPPSLSVAVNAAW